MSEMPDRFYLRQLSEELRQNERLAARILLPMGLFVAFAAALKWVDRFVNHRESTNFFLDDAVWGIIIAGLLIARGWQLRNRVRRREVVATKATEGANA